MTTDFPSSCAGAVALALASGLTTAHAQGLPAATDNPAIQAAPVVVVVRIPKPWYAPQAIAVRKMRDTVPEYARLPGLMFKAFSFERASSDFGGLYFWRDRASAEAWFTPDWFERVRKDRGAEAWVRSFEAPVTIVNTGAATPAASEGKAVGTLVEIPIPAGVTRERLVAEFKAAVPAHQKAPGLLRKHFIISSHGRFGGLYLWKDEASARAWFGEAWHERVVKAYGQDAVIEWFDVPLLLPTQDAANLAAAQALVTAAP